jgi:hypothetical protein
MGPLCRVKVGPTGRASRAAGAAPLMRGVSMRPSAHRPGHPRPSQGEPIMQITVAALNAAPELRGLAHDLREVSDRVDVLAVVLESPAAGDITVNEIYRDLMETVGQTSSTVTAIAHAAESVA